MGANEDHALARTTEVCAKREATFGTLSRPTSAAPGSIDVISCEIEYTTNETHTRQNANGRSRARKGKIKGRKKPPEWSLKNEIKPSGTLGVLAEDDVLLRGLMGGKTIRKQITILDYTQGVGATVTVTVNGSATVLTGVSGAPGASEFQAATSNNATATSLEAKIEAIAGLSSSPSSAVITIDSEDTVDSLTIAISVPGFASTVGVYVKYQPKATQRLTGSMTLCAKKEIEMRTALGAWVDSYKVSGKQGEPPLQEWAGSAKSTVRTLATQVNGVVSGSASVTVDDSKNLEADSVVAFGTSSAATNSGEGFKVSSMSGAVATLETTTSIADDTQVLPFLPAPSYLGSPLDGITTTLTLNPNSEGAIDVTDDLVEFSIEAKGNTHAHVTAKEKIQAKTEGRFEPSGTFKLYMAQSKQKLLARYLDDPTLTWAIELTIGDTSGRKRVYSLPCAYQVEPDIEESDDEPSYLVLHVEGHSTAADTSDSLVITDQ